MPQSISYDENQHKPDEIVLITKCEMTPIGFSVFIKECKSNVELTVRKSLRETYGSVLRIGKTSVKKMIVLDIDSFNSESNVFDMLRRISSYANIMVMSSNVNAIEAIRMTKAGVKAYINKSSDPEKFKEAIRVVSSSKWWSGSEFSYLFNTKGMSDINHHMSGAKVAFLNLTNCEQQVIIELLKGRSQTEISLRLFKSVKTISAQKQSAMRKLGVRNLIDLYSSHHELIA